MIVARSCRKAMVTSLRMLFILGGSLELGKETGAVLLLI